MFGSLAPRTPPKTSKNVTKPDEHGKQQYTHQIPINCNSTIFDRGSHHWNSLGRRRDLRSHRLPSKEHRGGHEPSKKLKSTGGYAVFWRSVFVAVYGSVLLCVSC